MTSNETTAAQDEFEPEDGKIFQREDALPASHGGGVVFPEGALGRAFHLDEWSFIRYCTAQSEREHHDRIEAKKGSRLKDLKTLVSWAGSFVLGLALVWMTKETSLTWAPMYVVLCIFCIGALLYRSLRTPGWFSTAYPEARPVPLLQQWPLVARLDRARRSLSSLWLRAWRIALLLFLAWYAPTESGMDSIVDGAATILLGLAAFNDLLTLIFLFIYLPVRFGTVPTSEDLRPL